MKKNDEPYVVSADLAILTGRWCTKSGFVCPDQIVFDELRCDFSHHMKTMFPNFVLLPEWRLKEGFWQFASGNKLPLVSLERVYDVKSPEHLRLDCCRGEEHTGGGIMGRAGFDLWNELQKLRRAVPSNLEGIAIWDDVLYSGSLMEKVLQLLLKEFIRVKHVFVGVGVQTVDGLRGGCTKLREAGVSVKCIYEYESVIDQVCERDFYPGILFGGRSIRGNENFSYPYLLPFGDPHRWASIPKTHEIRFSRFCIELTIRLFEEIERCSGRKVYTRDLERKMFHYPKGKVALPKGNIRHVDALKKAYKTL